MRQLPGLSYIKSTAHSSNTTHREHTVRQLKYSEYTAIAPPKLQKCSCVHHTNFSAVHTPSIGNAQRVSSNIANRHRYCFSTAACTHRNYTAVHTKHYASQLKYCKYTAAYIKRRICTAVHTKHREYTASQLKYCEYTATYIKDRNCTAVHTKHRRYTASQHTSTVSMQRYLCSTAACAHHKSKHRKSTASRLKC